MSVYPKKRKPISQWNWGKRTGRPWTDSDIESALFLRHCGLTNADIGQALNRSTQAINLKIGYVPTIRQGAVKYDVERAVHAQLMGRMIDRVVARLPARGTA